MVDEVSSDDELFEESTQYLESSDSSEETPHVHEAFNRTNANTLGNYSNVIGELKNSRLGSVDRTSCSSDDGEYSGQEKRSTCLLVDENEEEFRMSTQAPESSQPYVDLQSARTKGNTKKPIPTPRKRNKQPTQAERNRSSEACVMVGNNEQKLYEPNNVLVTGFSENTSADTLLYYMERMTEKDVEKVRFLGQGKAVVTTKEPLEFDKLVMKVGNRLLDERQLSVERINLCDSILVSNLPQVTNDSILLYFENVRRSGGGDVKDVNYSKEKHCAIIVFEEYQVVDNVVSREHTLEGKLVSVEKHYPQISSHTITDSSSTDPVSYFHETPKHDTRETHERPQETQGTEGRPQETQGRPQETQKRPQETQEKPHETQGRPQETQKRPQETQEKPHETQGRPQETQKRPQETQGRPQETQGRQQETQGRRQETRDDISDRRMSTTVEIDNDIMQFIMSGTHASKLEGKVDDLKAEIQWERENEAVTLIKKVKSGYVKRWENNCQNAVSEFFDQFEKFSIPLNATVAAVIEDVLSRLLGDVLRGKAFCKSDEDKKNLVVVCLEDQRHDVRQSIESFLEMVEKEEVRKAYQKEEIEDISHERMQFLQHIKFVDEIRYKNPELEIRLDLEQHMIYLEGPREQVRNCKKEYSRVMDAITEESFILPSATIQDIVTSQRGVRYFKHKLALQNITAMLFKERNAIKIVAKSFADCQNAKTCLLESVYKEEISVSVENAFIFQTDDGQNLITELNNNELVKITIGSSGKYVVICGILEVVVDVKKEIEKFIEREKIQNNSFEVPKTVRRFLSQHSMDKLKDIEERLKLSYVSIEIDQALIQMKGTSKGLAECADLFFQLCDTIVTKDEKFSSPGLGKLMFGEKGRRNVKLVEMERKVIIDMTKTVGANLDRAYRVRSEVESVKEDENQTPSASEEQLPDLRGEKAQLYDLCNFTTKEGIKVSWKYGNLENQTADILVNSGNQVVSNLTVCGKALLNVGGQQFVAACKAHANVVAGEIACTSGGNLACKNVLHAVCCDWDNSGNAEKLLHDLVKKILAKSIQLNATSVVFPTIGTGQHSFPEKVVFEVYRKEIEDFSAANPSQTCLKDIRIIVFKGGKSSANPPPSPAPSGVPVPGPAGPTPAVASPQVKTVCVYDTCNFTTNNGIKVTWKYGNIENESASVLVNSALSNLNSPTACGKALNAVGGPTFIQACTSHNNIGEGNIVCTVGGNLQCQNVLHAVCCDWNKGKGEKILRSLVSKILTKCETLGATSLAMPTIGTAGHKFREQFVLQVYKEEIEKFSTKNPSKLLLKDIRVVVFSAKQPKTQSAPQPVSSPPSAVPPQVGGSRVVTFGQVQVSLHEGDITQQATPSDGLINLLPSDLKLKNGGGVCTSILKSGGAAIQTQLDASGNQPLGSIIRTGPGSIKNYKQILNVIPTSNNVPGLQNAVEKCLNEAKTQAMGSVSIPAIGTAGFNINPVDSAELILNAVKSFSNVNYALVVNIVVFQKNMVPHFEAKIHEKASGNTVQAPAIPQPQPAVAPQAVAPQAVAPQAVAPQAVARQATAPQATATQAMATPPPPQAAPAVQAAVPTAITDYKTLKTGQTPEVIRVNIVASSKKSADESLLDMEKFIKENIGVARIKHQNLLDVLSKNWPKIQNLARDNEVSISCTSATDVEIKGLVEKASECKDKVQSLMDEYDDEERKVNQRKSVCKIISKTVQWTYMQTNQSVNYDKELNTTIEIAFSAQENQACQVSKNGDNYQIDFTAMTEKNLKTGQIVQISRKLLGDNSSSNSSGIQLPSNWIAQPQGKMVHLVSLAKTSPEYLQIQNLFISTGGTTNASQVHSIERVQNPGLYQAYAIKKQTMGNNHNEMRLFHGTNANNSNSISINNFNRSYAGINGVALGVGVYFAKQASTSLGYSKRGGNTTGYFQMFVGKVLVGTYAKGANGMKNPPPKNDPNNPGLLHDSTVNDTQNPNVFVVFLDHQCYPEYLITFK